VVVLLQEGVFLTRWSDLWSAIIRQVCVADNSLFLIIFMAIFLSCLPTLLPTCGCPAKQASYEPQPAGGAKKKSCSRLLGKG